MRPMLFTASQITVTNLTPEVTILDPDGGIRRLHADDKGYRDPNGAEVKARWDEDKLVAFTRSVFIALNVALETKNLDPVQPSMEPELFGRYKGMVDDLRSKGERLERRNLAVRDVEIVLVKNYYDNRKDSFTAWVSGQAQTAVTDEKTGKMTQGDDHVADFEEFWTFQREGDRWRLSEIEKAYSNSSVVGEENVDEGSDKGLMEFYYSKDRAV